MLILKFQTLVLSRKHITRCNLNHIQRFFGTRSILVQKQMLLQSTSLNEIANDKPGSSKLKSFYEENLDDYFKTQTFKFKGEKHVDDLRRWMENVYLRRKLLIAIDIEAWERNINKVTEIGVAIYDPTKQLSSIFPTIQQFHIIIREHEKMVNGRYCPNNKHNFMGGVSYNLGLGESRKFLGTLIRKCCEESEEGIVLVGHHIEGDLKWLRSIGIQFPKETPVVDTARIHGISYESGGSLRGILRKVGIPHGYLHNAANDAYYTLLASLAYCDPNTRTQKKLDEFYPHIVEPSSGLSSKARKRRERMFDTSVSIHHSDGFKLYNELFTEKDSDDELHP